MVLAIFGPTASGKTAVAEAIARRIPADLVSADSMQIYRGLPILTNQGAIGDRRAKLVGIWPLDRQGSVAEYQELAHRAIDETLAAGRTPIVVGGSALWFRVALVELDLPPVVAGAERERWQRLYDRAGGDVAHGILAQRDPRAAELVHPNDRKRVVRALELWRAGSSLAPAAESRLWTDEARHPTLVVGLDVPAEVLEGRIRRRTREMFARNVVAEVGAAGAIVPQVLGVEEIRSLPPPEAEEQLVLRTRQFAAYQRKWMRRIPGLVTVAGDRPPGEIADDIVALGRQRERLPAHGGAGADA
jgi:tRNA dimethylallyltransferase